MILKHSPRCAGREPGRSRTAQAAAVLVALLMLVAAGCATSTPTPTPTRTPMARPGTPASAELAIVTTPAAARVIVNGRMAGVSPLTLTLPAGEHTIALSADGYAPLTETLALAPGQEGVYSPALVALPLILGPAAASPATPGLTQPAPTAALTAASPSPAASPSASPSASPPLGTATPSPSASAPPLTWTPTPTATGTPATPPVAFWVTEISIPTYPYTPFLRSVVDAGLGDYPLLILDRAAYEASHGQPAPVNYTLLVLENRYLRLTILPELGGRIYECIFKPTGHNEFYRNPVIKPTKWGPPSPPYPAGANWWLAAGGLEWGFPVEEHGYTWGVEWGYDHAVLPDGSVQVSLFTGDFRRPYAVVEIILPPDAAYFAVRPTIVNPRGAAFRFKWWANAMLAPGAANAPSAELRFIFPVSAVTVHSSGDPTLPGPGQAMSWPIHNGRDLSRLGEWTRWLGFFARPAAAGDFMAVYDRAAAEGMARIYPSSVAAGAKGFAMGWRDPLDWNQWTDDGSAYVELHGGLAATFDDWITLPAGGQVSWSEAWYPVAGIRDVTYAGPAGAVSLARGDVRSATGSGPGLEVGVFPTHAVRGQLKLTIAGLAPIGRSVDISPAKPFRETIPYTTAVPGQGEVTLALVNAQGHVVLEYRGQVILR
jgi:hypothetical protein